MDLSRITAERFGDEWHDFSVVGEYSKDQFLDWIHPLTQEFLRGKRVLDAGCGNGRLITWAQKFGASEVCGIDFGKAVEVARRNTRAFGNVHIVQADIRHLPLLPEFDYIYCIGVLHHLPDPSEGFRALTKVLKPGGTLSVWVYGEEGNELVRRFIDPIRTKFTSKLPSVVLHPISFIFTLFAYALLKVIYIPIAQDAMWLYKRLPMHEYIRTWFPYPFHEVYNLIHDQLITPITHYISKATLEQWVVEAGMNECTITQRGGNGWRLCAKK